MSLFPPRYWAYSQLLLSKTSSWVSEWWLDHQSPERNGHDYGLFQKILYFWSRDPTPVLDHLYLGSAKNAADFEGLTRNEIALVVNATQQVPNFFPDHQEYHRLPIMDIRDASLLPHRDLLHRTLDRVHDSIQSGQSVLVHCLMGASRSVAFVCLYLMRYHEKTADEAYQMVLNAREAACINVNFLEELRRWDAPLET